MSGSNIKYIDIDNTIYKCKVFDKNKKCKKGYAYVKGKFIYPYMGKYKKGEKMSPGIYMKKDGSYKIIKALNKAYKYKIELSYDPDDDFINKIIETEGVMEQDLDIIMGETLDVFAPIINNDDNTLQRLIKRALQLKQIDLKNYEKRFANKGDASNHKSSLLHHGKMSLEKFIKWCNVLDLEFKIIVKDKEGAPNPMRQEIEEEY